MTSNFAIREINELSPKKKTPVRTITSFGTGLDQDDMIMQREEDEEQQEANPTGLIGQTLAPTKKLSKDFGVFLILKSRFGNEPRDKKWLFKRKEDFVKDLSLNMLSGKITRETYFMEDSSRSKQLKLVKALEVEPGNREVEQYK